MSELIENDPMTVRKILSKSVSFIFKNILWIVFIGFLISLSELSFDDLFFPSGLYEIIKYKIFEHLFGIVFNSLLAGMVTVLLAEHFWGRKMAWYLGLKKSLIKWGPLIILQLVIQIMTLVGGMLLVVPGIIIGCASACAVPAMMIEDLMLVESIERSWNLTKNNRIRIFGYLLLNLIISGIVVAITQSTIEFILINPIYQIGVMALIFSPFQALWPAIATLLFFDLRSRKKAMDLEVENKKILVEAKAIG